MEIKVLEYINKNIRNADLKIFLIKLFSSAKISEKLLCLCILIDLKYKLLPEDSFLPICVNDSFCSTTDYANTMPVIFNNHYKEEKKYSRVIALEVFTSWVGSFNHNNKRLKIDPKKIVDIGWSGKKGIVWITLHYEIKQIIEDSKHEEFAANKVCDFVGFARSIDRSATASPRTSPHKEFVVINYSEKFDDVVYQPNSSNADWNYSDTLFICYNNSDGFGRTYNENGVVFEKQFAKERVHQTSYYYDKEFEALYVGKTSVDNLTRAEILQEAFNRLNI